jgi:hypothetical protein
VGKQGASAGRRERSGVDVVDAIAELVEGFSERQIDALHRGSQSPAVARRQLGEEAVGAPGFQQEALRYFSTTSPSAPAGASNRCNFYRRAQSIEPANQDVMYPRGHCGLYVTNRTARLRRRIVVRGKLVHAAYS